MALLDEILRVFIPGKIGRDRHELAVGGPGDLRGGCLSGSLRRAHIATLTPSLCQSKRDAFADSFAAAGDERGLAVELKIHA